MKHWICIVWIILVGLQMGYQGMVYAYYSLQKEQITQDFCENKNQPALECNGKCHLKTLLAASEDPASGSKESSIPPKEIHIQLLIGLLQPLTTLNSSPFISVIALWQAPNKGHYTSPYEYLAIFELLDPPKKEGLS